MASAAGFFRDKTAPRLLMIAALLLLTISQFFAYFEDPTTGLVALGTGFGVAGSDRLGLGGTGWQLHPQAYLILAVMGFAFLRDDVAEHPLFLRFGYWICFALIFAAVSPGAPIRAAGAAMGGIALLMGLVAAIWHQLLPRIVDEPFRRKSPPEP